MREPAPAKVNLYLHVTGRRADGYHLLDSLAVFGPAADLLAAAPAAALTLALEGPFAAGLAAEPDNLVLRAARALAAEAGLPGGAALRLAKHLPVASGIGGGSADAAAALRLLDRLWGLGLPEARLAAIAARLGADVPVCLASRPRRMQGVGEVLRPAPALPDCGLLLVNPGVALATPAVFRARPRRLHPGRRAARGLARCGGHGRRPRPAAERPRGPGHRALPAGGRGAGGAGPAARLPAGADERQRRHLLRAVRQPRRGRGGGGGAAGRLVARGRGAVPGGLSGPAARRGFTRAGRGPIQAPSPRRPAGGA